MKPAPKSVHRWTIRQQQQLIRLYPTHSYGQIAQLLNLKPMAVHNKINKLKLKKTTLSTSQN